MSLQSSFSPSDRVEFFHSFPRTTDTTEVYEHSLTNYALGLLGIAIACFVLFLISMITYCCARCRCKRRNSNPWFNRCCFFFTAGLLVTAAVISASQVAIMDQGAMDAIDAIDDGGDLVDRIDSQNTALRTSLGQVDSDISAILADPTLTPFARSELESVQADVQSARSESVQVDDGVDQLGEDIDQIVDDANEYKDASFLVLVVYVCVAGTWSLLALLTILLKCKCCAGFHKLIIVLGIVLLVFLWIVFIVITLASVVMSDICNDPERALTEATSDPNAEYYLYCDANPTLSTTGLYLGDLLDGQASIANGADDLDALIAATPPAATYYDDLEDLRASITVVEAQVDGIVSLASCGPANRVWRKAREGLCTDSINGLIGVWALQLVSAFLLLAALIIAIPFWYQHPATVTVHHDNNEMIKV